MSQRKEFPESDDARELALKKAIDKRDGPPIDDIFLPDNSASLTINQPLFILKRQAVRNAETARNIAVVDFDVIIEKLKKRASAGLQLLNFKIDIGDFPASVRSMYGLPLDTGNLPPYDTEDQIIQMAHDFINGETARIAAGGAPLADITRASVQALLTTLETDRTTKQAKLNLLTNALIVLDELRVVVDTLIENLWDDIDHAGQGMPKGAKNDFKRSWGIIISHVANNSIVNVKCVDIDTNVILAGVSLRIGLETGIGGAKATSNAHGEAIMHSVNIGDTSINATLALYNKLSRAITLVEDEEQTIVMKLKKTPIEI
ncbi:MAG: hypothetical protein WCL14_02520 [Bacteroidota bacterium]